MEWMPAPSTTTVGPGPAEETVQSLSFTCSKENLLAQRGLNFHGNEQGSFLKS
jgi:hypothetical protein